MFKVMPPYTMPDNFTEAHFKPWIGSNYEKGGCWGKRVLVLGESHYTKMYTDTPPELTTSYTRHIIQLYAVQKNDIFYAKVRNLILRGLTLPTNCYGTEKQRQFFWNSIAFYNYVQEYVGTKPKQRPNADAWERSKPGFWEVLEKLKPEVCITLGNELWDNLPKTDQQIVSSVVSFKDEKTNVTFKRITYAGHETLFAHTPHPSSFGEFKTKKVVPIMQRLLELKGA
jgi:hypothetical protein